MGEMRKLDRNGDTKHEWDPSKPDEVEIARELFHEYKAQGFAAARMENDTTGEILLEFDPGAGTIVFVPQMKGG
jgi:hypothetical protein